MIKNILNTTVWHKYYSRLDAKNSSTCSLHTGETIVGLLGNVTAFFQIILNQIA